MIDLALKTDDFTYQKQLEPDDAAAIQAALDTITFLLARHLPAQPARVRPSRGRAGASRAGTPSGRGPTGEMP